MKMSQSVVPFRRTNLPMFSRYILAVGDILEKKSVVLNNFLISGLLQNTITDSPFSV